MNGVLALCPVLFMLLPTVLPACEAADVLCYRSKLNSTSANYGRDDSLIPAHKQAVSEIRHAYRRQNSVKANPFSNDNLVGLLFFAVEVWNTMWLPVHPR